MAVTNDLLSKIKFYEGKGYSPDEIVAGIKASGKYQDVSAKIDSYSGQGYGSDEVLAGIKQSPVVSQADMQKQFASRQGTPETAAKYGVNSGQPDDGVPQWGRDHPNLYGLYGAAKGVASAAVEGAATAGVGALGAIAPIPGGTIVGSGLGFAAGKRVSQAAGLSDEPMDNSATGVAKDVAIGSAMGVIPAAAGLASKGVRMLPGGDTAMNLLTKAPVGKGMLEAARVPDVAKVTSAMDTIFAKAVRPGVAGNRTLTQSESYTNSARNAVKEIVLNKDNLGLTDVDGVATDTLPKNLPQFRQAIDTTKRSIWQRVEDINKSAGESGAEVPLQSAVDELNSLANKPVYKTMSPETVNYATSRAKSLGKQRAFTVEDAQDAITLANQSTKNFYQNPSADTASKAYVDSLIANHLRANLDTALEAATGTPAAAPLRKAYGSLKAIEKDVNQRAVVDARKNSRGLVDFSDIYTAGELVKAMATMSPVGIAKTGTMAAVKAFIKRANDPNTHVERLFKLGDKLVSKTDFSLPEVTPTLPADIPLPPWAGKVNNMGNVQPGPDLNPMRPVNTLGNMQPGPAVNQMGPVNTGVPGTLRQLVNMNGVNTMNPDAPARFQVSPNLISPSKSRSLKDLGRK